MSEWIIESVLSSVVPDEDRSPGSATGVDIIWVEDHK